jgi:hypothetical protein
MLRRDIPSAQIPTEPKSEKALPSLKLILLFLHGYALEPQKMRPCACITRRGCTSVSWRCYFHLPALAYHPNAHWPTLPTLLSLLTRHLLFHPSHYLLCPHRCSKKNFVDGPRLLLTCEEVIAVRGMGGVCSRAPHCVYNCARAHPCSFLPTHSLTLHPPLHHSHSSTDPAREAVCPLQGCAPLLQLLQHYARGRWH